MNKMIKLLGLAALISAAHSLKAQDVPDFNNLTLPQVEAVSEEFATSFVPTNVSGASTLGAIWGIEAGIIGGTSGADEIDRLSGASTDLSSLPHGSLLARATGPFGLGANVQLLPIDIGDFTYDYSSFGVSWTLTEVLDIIPVDILIGLSFYSAELGYTQTVGLQSVGVSYESSGTKPYLIVSKKIALIEPYIGAGFISASSELTEESPSDLVSIFDSAQTRNAASDLSESSSLFFIGANLNLLLLNLGIEYMSVLDNQRVTGKVSLTF